MDKNYLNLDWSPVEKALSEGTFSGYKIAIIETHKLFANLLEKAAIDDERLLPLVVRLPKAIEYTKNMYRKLIEESGFEISREDTKEIIGNYWQIMEALDQMTPLTYKDKLKLKYQLFKNRKKKEF